MPVFPLLPRDLLTAQDVARRLSIGVRTLWPWSLRELASTDPPYAATSSDGRRRTSIAMSSYCRPLPRSARRGMMTRSPPRSPTRRDAPMNDTKRPWSLAVLLDEPAGRLHGGGAASPRTSASPASASWRLEGRPEADREALADAGLLVRCAAVGQDALPAARWTPPTLGGAARRWSGCGDRLPTPPGWGRRAPTSSPAWTAARRGWPVSPRHAVCWRIMPPADDTTCVRPIPGRALPNAAPTRAWLRRAAHPNLGLLLDVGHCLISGEDAAAAAARGTAAGSRPSRRQRRHRRSALVAAVRPADRGAADRAGGGGPRRKGGFRGA